MQDMNHATGTEILLTSDDVRRWQDELRRLEQSQKETETRIVALRRKLDAVALIAGTKPALTMPPHETTADPDKNETMGEAAKRLLGAFNRPVLHFELQAELRKIPQFDEMLSRNNGAYYYTVIKRLAEAKLIKKMGKKIRLVHKDEAPPEGNPEGAPKSTVEG
jgi:hypothetical protein